MLKLLMSSVIGFFFLASTSKSWDKELRMAKASVLGYAVTNTKGFNNRIFEKKRVQNLRKPSKTIILGSSRAMKIDGDVIGNKRVENLGVSSGVLNDMFGLYYLYASNFSHPKEVVLVVDPWFLMDKKNDGRWKKAYKTETEKMRAIVNGRSSEEIKQIDRSNIVFPKNLQEVYSLSEFYFKQSDIDELKANKEIYKEYYQMLKIHKKIQNDLQVNQLLEVSDFYDELEARNELYLNETANMLIEETNGYRHKKFKRLKYYQKLNIVKLNRIVLELTYALKSIENCDEIITRKNKSGEVSLMSDGTIFYKDFWEDTIDLTEINKRVLKRGSGPFEVIANEKFSTQKNHKSIFEKYVSYLQQSDVKVSIAMIPYHPKISPKLNGTKFPFVKEMEKYLRKFGKERELDIIGGYFPQPFNVTESDFYDDIHIRKTGLMKLGFK